MAIEYKGTVLVTSDANSGSQAVTVPADSTLCIVFVAHYEHTFDSNAIVLDSQSAVLIGKATHATTHQDCWAYSILGFGTGSKTFAWDWNDTGTPDEGAAYMLMFFSGTDLTTPVRDWDQVVGTSLDQDWTTPAIDSSGTDLVVGGAAGYTATLDMNLSSQTERIAPGVYNSVQYDCATVAGAAPNKTITVNGKNVGLVGVSLQPAEAPAGNRRRRLLICGRAR